MQPLDRKNTKSSKSVSRVKMLIKARIDWLQGFPLASEGEPLKWCCPLSPNQPEGTLSISGKLISKTTRTINELKRDFPNALPLAVGDVKAWEDDRLFVLEAIKQELHSSAMSFKNYLLAGKCYPLSTIELATSIVDAEPGLEPLLSALAWSYLTRKGELKTILKFVKENRDAILPLARIDLSVAIQICVISQTGRSNMDGLLTLVSKDFLALSYDGEKYARNVAGIIRHGDTPLVVPKTPTPTHHQVVFPFIKWLVNSDARVQKTTLTILGALALDRGIDTCVAWWKKVDDLANKCVSASRHPFYEKEKLTRSEHQKKMLGLAETYPEEINFHQLIHGLKVLAEETSLSSTLMSLAAKQTSPLTSWKYVVHYADLFLEFGSRFKRYLISLNHYLDKYPERIYTTAWAEIKKQSYYGTVDYNLLSDTKENDRIEMVLAAVSHITARTNKGVSSKEVDLIIDLVNVRLSLERVCTLFSIFRENGLSESYLQLGIIKSALLLDEGSDQELFALYKTIDKFTEDAHIDGDIALMINELLRLFDDKVLFKHLIVKGYLKELTHSAHKAKMLVLCGDNIKPPKIPSALRISALWIERYPIEFTPLLEQLASVDNSAQRSAERILGRYFPSDDAIRNEIAFIQKKLAENTRNDNVKLESRKASLLSRITDSSELSEEKICNLQDKLSNLITLKRYEKWRAELDSVFTQELQRYLDIDACPPWLLEPRTIKWLTPIADLKTVDRKLAVQVIKARTGDAPWDFRDELPNREFIRAMETKGINMDPWLNGMAFKRQPDIGITLTMEHDPLEILEMGAHFKTCLSPGGFNFFSVFANIADINKRVVYGRDDAGKVVGRVLLALTDNGGILVFNPYCHDRRHGFPEQVSRFVAQLSVSMHSIIVRYGKVSTLVAKNWYDDGPIDIGNQFAFLEPGSDFRNSIATLTERNFFEWLQRIFAPIPLNSLTLPLVTALPELARNPKLALPLASLSLGIDDLPLAALLEILRLSLDADQSQPCFRLLEAKVIRGLKQQFRERAWLDEQDIELVIQINPSRGLTLLKETRPRYVRSWVQDWPQRKALAVKAFQMLGREKQAERLSKR